MTDVVEIAKSRRSKLAAEIAKLDDFIHMAEILLRYGDGPGKGRADDGDASRPMSLLFNGDAGKKESVSQNTMPDGDSTKPGAKAGREASTPSEMRAVVRESATTARTPTDDSKGTREDSDHFQFTVRTSADDEELVLTERDMANQAPVDASLGQKLRQRRWMIGMTKKQLVERIGGNVEEIEKYERDEAQIATGRMWTLARALGVPTSYFFEEASDQSPGTGETRGQASSPAQAGALAKTA